MNLEIFPKISIVTPNFNQERFIEQTILSVLDQDYPNFEYIVIDGGSTDNSVEIIKKYADRLTYWTTEKDNGMYDAINKGFKRSTGDIMCWINSDDILAEDALQYVAEVFSKNQQMQWLMGFPSIMNEQSEITWQGQDAQVFTPLFFYLHNHARTFSFIQQESTFWTRALWEKAGGKLDLDYSLAADFDLWMRFFAHEKLYFSHRQLAAFRRRSGQLSENQDQYVLQTNLAVASNQKNVSGWVRFNIFFLKSLRKTLFSFRNKKIRNLYYSLQKKLLGTPNWVD